MDVRKVFKTGLEYIPPRSLVGTRGKDWTFQPHRDLYSILATNVLEHYDHYKRDEIDKNYIPSYFYLGGAGTGKSRCGSEFASSIQQAIAPYAEDPAYHDLAERLKNAFVFHVSFENGTPFSPEEMSDPWNAIGVRMLHQLRDEPFSYIRRDYVADPYDIFQLVAKAKGVDLHEDFTGILVVDGFQLMLTQVDDGQNKNSTFYRLLTKIGALSLMARSSAADKGTEAPKGRKAPFIMTCITATCFGPVTSFLAYTGRRRVYLPLNKIEPPTWKFNGLPVFQTTQFTEIFVKDIGGHARAMEIIADLLAQRPNDDPEPSIDDFARDLCSGLEQRYREAFILISDYALPIAQCILSRREILLEHEVPGTIKHWHDVTSSGLIWFKPRTDFGTRGYLEAPYIWLWMLARLSPSGNTERLCHFLRQWEFNDYRQLLGLETGDGLSNPTWQRFEVFCCSFRVLRSLGFEDGEEVPLKVFHSGCNLRDDWETMVVNRHLKFAEAAKRYKTKSTKRAHGNAWIAEDVETKNGRTLNAEAQLSYVIRNAMGAKAGDLFMSIETPEKRFRRSESEIVREVGLCKFIQDRLTKKMYNHERNKAAGNHDIFILYTHTESDDFILPDRSGLVDESCWDSYFGPFAGRAFLASKYGRSSSNSSSFESDTAMDGGDSDIDTD